MTWPAASAPPTTVWWLSYLRAGDHLYWWTTLRGWETTHGTVIEAVRSRVAPETWTSCTVLDGADDEPALAASGAIDWASIGGTLAELALQLPGSRTPDEDAERRDTQRTMRRRRDFPDDNSTADDQFVDHVELMTRRARREHDAVAAALRRSWNGALVDPVAAAAPMAALGTALLPPLLREYLTADSDSTSPQALPQPPTTVVVSTTPDIAFVPWELLHLDTTGTTLIERARIRGGITPASLVNLARPATADDLEAPALRVIDPGPARSPDGNAVYPAGRPQIWTSQEDRRHRDVTIGRKPADDGPASSRGATREELSDLLTQQQWSQLTYLGHVASADADSPTSASLIFERTFPPRPVLRIDDGRPLEVSGTTHRLSARVWLHRPHKWPMPRRVGIIACQADDSRYVEPLGLTLAAVNAGARIVATTRWTLPTDQTTALVGESVEPGAGPTTGVAVAVDAALSDDDPVGHLRGWQLRQLAQWRSSVDATERRRYAPLLWASVVVYVLPDDVTP